MGRMQANPLWPVTTRFPKLDHDISLDVVVVGGGMAGISFAYHLYKKGHQGAPLLPAEVGGASTSPGESNVFNIPALSISPEQSHRREDEDLLRRAAGDAEEELQLQGAFLDSRTLGSHPEQVRQRARPSERLEVGEVHRDI